MERMELPECIRTYERVENLLSKDLLGNVVVVLYDAKTLKL